MKSKSFRYFRINVDFDIIEITRFGRSFFIRFSCIKSLIKQFRAAADWLEKQK